MHFKNAWHKRRVYKSIRKKSKIYRGKYIVKNVQIVYKIFAIIIGTSTQGLGHNLKECVKEIVVQFAFKS